MGRLVSAWFACTWLSVALTAWPGDAGQAAKEPTAPSGMSTRVPTNLLLKQVGPELFEIGRVKFDKRQKTVVIPAALNMSDGLLEYLLVTSYGKTHESLLRTEAEPVHIHLAMLLLGANGAGTNVFPKDPFTPLPGDKITLELSWKKGNREQQRRAEELVYSRRTRSAMTQGEWIYNGSQVFEGTFAAQRDGSIISLITDPDALINNPRPDREDDENWGVNKARVPAPETPVQVTIKLHP